MIEQRDEVVKSTIMPRNLVDGTAGQKIGKWEELTAPLTTRL